MGNEKNKSALQFDNFNDVSRDTRDAVQMQHDSLVGASPKVTVNTGRGAAAGCKPGTSRKTFVLPLELIDKLGAIAAHTRKKEVAIVLDMLEKGVASYEQQYGKEISIVEKY
jgi:hypothetical protein